jgi:hypothetical protein
MTGYDGRRAPLEADVTPLHRPERTPATYRSRIGPRGG